MFHLLIHLLHTTPAGELARAIHDAAMTIGLEQDNITAIAVEQSFVVPHDSSQMPIFPHTPLQPVAPPLQYHFDSVPTSLTLHPGTDEIFLGSQEDPSGRPTVVLQSPELPPLHARIFRRAEPGGVRFFIEKVGPLGRITVRRYGQMIGLILHRGASLPIQGGDEIKLAKGVSFFFINSE